MSVVWKADATNGIEQEWASMSTADHCGTTTYAGLTDANLFQVADATAVHGRAYRAQLSSADNGKSPCYSPNMRTEINMGNNSKTFADGVDRTFHEGQERWISLQLKLDSSYPTYASGFQGCSLVQLTHPAGNDGGLFNLQGSYTPPGMHDQWGIWGYSTITPGNSGRYDHPLGDMLSCRGKWVKFTFHILFTTANTGFAEVYSDMANPGGFSTIPLLWAKTGAPTIKSGRAYAFMTFGFYGPPKPLPTMGANLCGLTCATDRASAEANAFGAAGPGGGGTPPVPSFTTTPSPSVTGQAVTFDASASTGVAPLSYAFTDAGASGALLGIQKIQPFTFQFAGTKLATLTVKDGTGLSSSVEHNLVVTAASSTPFPRGDLQSQPLLSVGADYFAKVITRLPANLPTSGFTSLRFASIDGPPSTSSPPISLGVTLSGGAIKWCLQRGTDYSNDIVWIGPTVDNAWHTFVLHVDMDTAAGPQSYRNLILSDSPSAYWRLDETSGTAMTDVLAATPGVYHGGFTLNQPGLLAGDVSPAATLDGSSGYASVAHTTALDVGDNFTLECLVSAASLANNPIILTNGTGGFVLRINATANFTIRQAGTADIVSSTAGSEASFTLNAPHHLVVTKNGAAVHLYLDGVDVTGVITNQTIANTAVGLVVGASTNGANTTGTTPFFNGTLDELAIYNHALTPAQVANHASRANGSASGNGYIELWMDGTKQTFTSSVQTLAMTTYGSDNNGGANWLDIECYRGSGWLTSYVQGTGQGGTTTAGTLNIYHAQPKIASTYASVQ